MAWRVAADIADRMRELVGTLDTSQATLARRAGVQPRQFSMWVSAKQRPSRSRLESWAQREGWPPEIFAEGGPRPSQALASLRVAEPRPTSSYGSDAAEADSTDHAGWMFGEPSEAEEQFRTYVRHLDRTHRMMVGDPAAVDARALRELQLVAVELAEKQCQLGGRPIPEFLRRIRNELIAGTFR